MRRDATHRAGEAARLAVLALAAGTLSACSEGAMRDWLLGPSSSTSTVAPAPSVTTSPSPLPTPRPITPATPTPTPVPGTAGAFPSNNSPVVYVHAKVFFVECDGTPIAGSEYASSAPRECRVHLDATPRDAANSHTRAAGGPAWYASGGRLNNPSSYTPVLTSRDASTATAYCHIDGVRSNDVVIGFY